jgi:chemotaxis-related protein WspB
MLVLMFEAGGHRYALETREVVEVVPWVQLQHVAGSPEYVAGYFSHRGEVIPAIDPGRLACEISCECRFNSRLIILDVPSSDGQRRVGLLGERVSTAHLEREGDGKRGAWGPLLLDEHGLFQLIELTRLLPPERLEAFGPARLPAKA